MTEIEKSGGNVPVRVLGADDRLQAWFDEAIALAERQPEGHVWPEDAPPPIADDIYAQLELITGTHYGPGDELPSVEGLVGVTADFLDQHQIPNGHVRNTSLFHAIGHAAGLRHR